MEAGNESELDVSAGQRSLRRMKLVPVGLLLLMMLLFVATFWLQGGVWWTGYARAFFEAAMVGALADWFAVTALFRHPLGIPIPHTAIVPTRKDEIGERLAAFIQRHFMTPANLRQRLREIDPALRVATWAGRNRHQVSEIAGRLVTWALQAVREDQAQKFLAEHVLSRLKHRRIAPTLAATLSVLVENGQHQHALTEVLRQAVILLDRHRDDIRQRIKQESPWWVPGFIDDRIFQQLLTKVEGRLNEIVLEPEHEARRRFDQTCRQWADDLANDTPAAQMVEALKQDLLNHPLVQDYAHALWERLRELMLAQAADANSPLRKAVTRVIRRVARDLEGNQALRDLLNRWLEDAFVFVVENNQQEITGLITETVKRWDADTAAARIELAVGRDLQFIRINGTVVGGLVGLIIHAFVHFAQA